MELRKYQKIAKQQLYTLLREFKRVLVVMPTGAGKTIFFTNIAEQFLRGGKTVFLLTESVKLLDQAVEEVEKFNISAGFIRGGFDYVEGKKFYACTAQTLKKRNLEGLEIPDLLIVDEAHAGNFDKILREFYPETKTIGLTATPINAKPKNKKEWLNTIYDRVLVGAQTTELIQGGFLVPAKTYISPKLKNALTGEEKGATQNDILRGMDIFTDAAQKIKKEKTKYSKYLVFCTDVAGVLFAKETFENNGLKVSIVHSKQTPRQQRKSLKFFEKGGVDICINCGILTKGYNFPPITDIVLLRKTKSLTLYLQMCGRGSRTFGEKTHFNVYDFCGNYYIHGPWQFDHDWENIFYYPDLFFGRKGKSIAPVKECPKCETFLNASAPICTKCDHRFGVNCPKCTYVNAKSALKCGHCKSSLMEDKKTGEVLVLADAKASGRSRAVRSIETMIAKNKRGQMTKAALFFSAFSYYYFIAKNILKENGYTENLDQYEKSFLPISQNTNKNLYIVYLKKLNPRDHFIRIYHHESKRYKDLSLAGPIMQIVDQVESMIKDKTHIYYISSNREVKDRRSIAHNITEKYKAYILNLPKTLKA